MLMHMALFGSGGGDDDDNNSQLIKNNGVMTNGYIRRILRHAPL